jgi:hypothetical protein
MDKISAGTINQNHVRTRLFLKLSSKSIQTTPFLVQLFCRFLHHLLSINFKYSQYPNSKGARNGFQTSEAGESSPHFIFSKLKSWRRSESSGRSNRIFVETYTLDI